MSISGSGSISDNTNIPGDNVPNPGEPPAPPLDDVSKTAHDVLLYNKEILESPEFRATMIKESPRLWKLKQKVVEFAGKFFSSAKKNSDDRIDKRKQHVIAQHQKLVEVSQNLKKDLLAFSETGEFPANEPLKLIMDAKTLEIKSVGHKTAAMLSTALGEIPEVPEMTIPGMPEPLVAHSHVPTEKSPSGKNAIIPSNQVEGKKGGPEHLINTYVVVIEGKNYGVIRSGMITKKEYADDFVNTVRDIVKQLPPELQGKPIRVVSQQLNSPENESRIINAQHRWMVYANRQLRDIGGEVVHINIPSNRWYFHTKNVERLGPLGSLLTSKVLKGERLSREMNLDSWGTYVEWTRQTLQGIPGAEGFSVPNDRARILKNKIGDLVEQIYKSEKMLSDGVLTKEDAQSVKTELKSLHHSLKVCRQEMRREMEAEYEKLTEFERHAENLLAKIGMGVQEDESGAIKNALEGAKLMRQVLGAQLEMPECKMSRGQEGMLIQLLNDRLGVHSGMNCKSGLDRTGFWHAVKLAMVRFERQYPKADMVNFVVKWDDHTSLLNKLEARLSKEGGTIEDYLEINTSKEKWFTAFRDLLPHDAIDWKKSPPTIKDDHLALIKLQIRRVIEFREMVKDNLLGVGLPITQVSTGFAGFKWNSGLIENLHPLNFIPSNLTSKSGETPPRRLVNFNSDGSVKGITRLGHAALVMLSGKRGS